MAKVSSSEFIPRIVKVKGYIWDRDSHGLFDYDAKHYTVSELTFAGCCYISLDQSLQIKQVFHEYDGYTNLAAIGF
jgi:hypothetical protein